MRYLHSQTKLSEPTFAPNYSARPSNNRKVERMPSNGSDSPGQKIDYAALALEAQRGIVRSVLSIVEENDCVLPGDHHFFIAFNTRANGVVLSKRLQEQYPREMTVVLQHRFWDLKVFHDRFEVRLTFNNLPERLVIPFASIKGFFDPSAQFALPLEHTETMIDAGHLAEVTERSGTVTELVPTSEKNQLEEDSEPLHISSVDEKDTTAPAQLEAVSDASDETEEQTAADSSTVVELDAFRKK